jgi:uncharacterized SAM-binding protein YcdF (DUF218 family)
MLSSTEQLSTPQPAHTPDKTAWLTHRGSGFILGVLGWLAATSLGLSSLPGLRSIEISSFGFLATGLAGAWLIKTRLRAFMWLLCGAMCLMLIILSSTPVIIPAVRALVRSDPLQKADAVYVLGAGILSNGDLSHPFQTRLLHGYEVIQQGATNTLIVPRLSPPAPPYLPAVQRQMQKLKIKANLVETPVVVNTHDEAVVIARLARERNWRRIILVTSPAHTRRAVAVFEKAGVKVLSSPCTEGDYDLNSPNEPGGRLTAFRDWLHETIGYQMYRLRGWI